jgi:hypothetical protein
MPEFGMWEDTHNEEAQSVTSKCAAEWIQSNRTPPWDLNVEIPAWVLKRAARLDPDCWPTFERLFMRGRAEYLSEPERVSTRAGPGIRSGSGSFGPVRCRCAALTAHRETWVAAAAHLLELPASGSVQTNVHKSVRVVLQPPVFSSGDPELELTPGITALVFTTKVTETIDSAEAIERPAMESVKPIRVAELKAMAQKYRRARCAGTVDAEDDEVVAGGAPGGGPYKNPPALSSMRKPALQAELYGHLDACASAAWGSAALRDQELKEIFVSAGQLRSHWEWTPRPREPEPETPEPEAPPGWRTAWNAQYGKWIYINQESNEPQFTRPVTDGDADNDGVANDRDAIVFRAARAAVEANLSGGLADLVEKVGGGDVQVEAIQYAGASTVGELRDLLTKTGSEFDCLITFGFDAGQCGRLLEELGLSGADTESPML